jgi:hypothetical protein
MSLAGATEAKLLAERGLDLIVSITITLST